MKHLTSKNRSSHKDEQCKQAEALQLGGPEPGGKGHYREKGHTACTKGWHGPCLYLAFPS